MNTTTQIQITDAPKQQFWEQGYFILESALPEEQLNLLRNECDFAVSNADAEMDAQGVEVLGINRRGNRYFIGQPSLSRPALQALSPFEASVAVVRIGEATICLNPAEPFVEFGLEIKSESPARVTMIAELTDDYCGYVRTAKAFARGGYETWCAPSSQLAFDAGDQIVAATRKLLQEVFEERN